MTRASSQRPLVMKTAITGQTTISRAGHFHERRSAKHARSFMRVILRAGSHLRAFTQAVARLSENLEGIVVITATINTVHLLLRRK